MSKIASYAPGSFCWADLATNDVAAAKHFYAEMFGWTSVDVPMPDGTYTLLQGRGRRRRGHDAGAVPACRVAGMSTLRWPAPMHGEAARLARRRGDRTDRSMPRTPAAWPSRRIRRAPSSACGRRGSTSARPMTGALGRVVWPELATPDPAGRGRVLQGVVRVGQQAGNRRRIRPVHGVAERRPEHRRDVADERAEVGRNSAALGIATSR